LHRRDPSLPKQAPSSKESADSEPLTPMSMTSRQSAAMLFPTVAFELTEEEAETMLAQSEEGAVQASMAQSLGFAEGYADMEGYGEQDGFEGEDAFGQDEGVESSFSEATAMLETSSLSMSRWASSSDEEPEWGEILF